MKVAFFNPKDWEREYIKNNTTKDLEISFFEHALDANHIPDETDFEAITVFVDSTVDEEVLDKFSNLRFITTRSTGYDHIDLEACKKRDIEVSNVPDYGANTVAEFTFGLLLSLVRKIHIGYDQVRETGSFSVEGLRGIDLQGKKLGVVGTGHIGRNVIRIARGFGMDVIAYDKFPNEDLAKKYEFEYKNLNDVFRESDIITLHVPYSKETHHMIDQEVLNEIISDNAYLVNTSRGGIVDTEALVHALKNGKLAGAALDVLEEEGVIKDELQFFVEGHPHEVNLKTVLANHILIDMPNVIVTPHNAFNTKEALLRILDTTLSNLQTFVDGEVDNKVS
ncbi:MAG: NAD(P)-dependent oxidoreductase [Candidatus Spechtbacterales bacterium]|nr:NAD(P)-dependent oxidoreductase [Candidatus Spechtbacterales bacterium]